MQPAHEAMDQNLEMVLRYAQAGYSVLPLHSVSGGKCSCGKVECHSAGKHPRTLKGAHESSASPETIADWGEKWPGCNWGMTLAGLVVIDVDPRHSGHETLADLLAKHGDLPQTPTQATGGGGRHYLFKAREGAHYKGGLGAGLDLKHGAGQFIVVEPSGHASGGNYSWLDEEGPQEGGMPALAPEWITGQAARSGNVIALPGADAIAAGGRNSFLYERCRRLRDLSLTQPEILAAAMAINQGRCTPPLSPDEVHTIAKSAAINDPDQKPTASAQFVDGAEFIRVITPPHWLIDGVIQRSYLYGLTAPTNHGKTALAALIAVCVGCGLKLGWRPVQAGHVLYLAGENPEDFKLRLRGTCQSLGIAGAELAGKISVMPVVDKLVTYHAAVREYANDHPLSLIIIDTSVAYFSYQDENSNVEAKLHAQDMRLLIQCAGSPAIVALCHPVKNALEDNLAPRGGSAFLNELDGNLTLWKEGETCELGYSKLRGPPFEAMAFRLTQLPLDGCFDSKDMPVYTVAASYVSDQDAESATDQAGDDAMAVLRALDALPKPSIAAIAAFCKWALADGNPAKAKAQRQLNRLLAEKYVVKRLGKYYLTEKGQKTLG